MVRRFVLLSLAIILWCGAGSATRTHPRHHSHHHPLATSKSAKTKAAYINTSYSNASRTLRSGRRHRRLRLVYWNPVFRPSHDSLLKQNAEIDRLELPRIQDDEELDRLKLEGKLVPIIPGDTLRIDPRLDVNRRYCRPWTRDFVEDLAASFYQRFGQQIQVNSAVRTVVVQRKLRRHNRNAAPAEGEIASSHLAGVTVDLQRRGMSKEQIHWVENYLIPMKAMGLVEPEEERRQWVFHIMVSDRYAGWREGIELASSQPEPVQPMVVHNPEPQPMVLRDPESQTIVPGLGVHQSGATLDLPGIPAPAQPLLAQPETQSNQ